MHIIGEKINGTRKQVAKAIAERDAGFIQSLARKQAEAGAHWLDVNAGTHPDREPDDLVWLIQTVQAVVEAPLCLDSANPHALRVALREVRQTPLINSISGETDRLTHVLPIVVEHGCEVIALCMDGKGIPATVEARRTVARSLIAETRRAGVPDEKVYFDPLVMTIATNTDAGRVTLDTIRAVHAEFPNVHISLGLSNVSFGLPARGLINRTFLALAVAAGMDAAIVDPLDRELKAALLATELLLGRDRHCLTYTRAYRAGLLEPVKQVA
ncbi:MAG TPA: dihydropteroate synthase [Anaerolineae bacterium]|nr:dihydropteroate synthase [Anaerolineae bacterium]